MRKLFEIDLSFLMLCTKISDPEKMEMLKHVSQELTRVIDFEESIAKNRLVPKQGFDPELDNSMHLLLFLLQFDFTTP